MYLKCQKKMKYINNIFTIEKSSLTKKIKKFETPIFCYSEKKINENINKFKNSFKSFSPIICFSTKSNCNLEILKLLNEMNWELMLSLKVN